MSRAPTREDLQAEEVALGAELERFKAQHEALAQWGMDIFRRLAALADKVRAYERERADGKNVVSFPRREPRGPFDADPPGKPAV